MAGKLKHLMAKRFQQDGNLLILIVFDEQDPFLLRRSSSSEWDKKQSWKIMTAGLTIPAGWEPFGYDGNDESDPVLLRQSSSSQWGS